MAVIRAIPQPVADALRAVHRSVVQHRPWVEVAAALDAVAELPEATDRDLIARERLEALACYPVTDVTDREVERVLRQTDAERAAMDDGGWWLERACWNRPVLVARHLVPHLERLQQTHPGDTGTISAIQGQIARARAAVPPEPEASDSSEVPADIVEAIRYGHALRGRLGWPHDAVFEVLDEAEKLPSAVEWMATLAHDRIIQADLYELDEAWMERTIQHAIAVHGGAPAWMLASAVLSAERHPALAAKYLPAIVQRAEVELRVEPHVHAEQVIAHARRVLGTESGDA